MRRISALVPVLALLAGCGGGGGAGTTGLVVAQPVAPQPAPGGSGGGTENGGTVGNGNGPGTSFATLGTQSFAADGASTALALNLVSRTSGPGTATREVVTVAYDAERGAYTLSASGRSQTFGSSDIVPTEFAGEVRYRRLNGDRSDVFTRVTATYSGFPARQYVQLGYWQSNLISGSNQDTQFATFVYGFPTLAAAVPRVGAAGYDVDVFGFTTVPEREPRVFQGDGRFNIDFLTGHFTTTTNPVDVGLISGDGGVGGLIELVGAGRLAADGSFSGLGRYAGRNLEMTGALSGRLFGPAGQELGATFTGRDNAGGTATAAFTGQRRDSFALISQTLTNIVASERFFSLAAQTFVRRPAAPGPFTFDARADIGGTVDRDTSGDIGVDGGIRAFTGTAANRVSGPPNFDRHQGTSGGQPVEIELYRSGASNTELPLTYTSLYRFRTTSSDDPRARFDYVTLGTYGIRTPRGLLGARTGVASYAGVVFGSGGNEVTQQLFEVSGTSRFSVDFSRQTMTGALSLSGREGGGAVTEFGSFDLEADVSFVRDSETRLSIRRGGTSMGSMDARFFGPSGEEIGGRFRVIIPAGQPSEGAAIAGVVVARQQ